MFKEFFINMLLVIVFLYLHGIITSQYLAHKNKMKKITSGIIFGLLGALLMYFSVPLEKNIIADLRHLAIILSFTYGKKLSGVITTFITVATRILLFGISLNSLIASGFIILMGVGCYIISTSSIKYLKKIRLMNIWSLFAVFLSLYSNLENLNKTMKIFPYHVTFSIPSMFFAYFIAEYIKKSNENYINFKYTSSQFNTLLYNLNFGILAEDDDNNITYINKKLLELLSIKADAKTILGEKSTVLIDKINHLFTNPKEFKTNTLNITNSRKSISNEELHLNDGRIFERDYIPIFNDNEYIGHFWSYRDITERKIIEKKLRMLSEVDGLTGLANRRSLNQSLENYYEESLKTKSVISVIMLDIDYFKLYNDTYGHLQGDLCLKSIAKVLTDKTKYTEYLAARFGGEEFIVLLNNTPVEKAEELALHIHKSIENLNINHKSSLISDHVTVSIGIASLIAESVYVKEEIISRADKALYLAKNNGRNRTEIYK